MGKIPIFARDGLKIMYNMKIRIALFLLISVFIGLSCSGNDEKSPVVVAYDEATAKVQNAENSEDLLEISYALHLELQTIGGNNDAPDVIQSRKRFEKALKEKEVGFCSKTKKKK